MRQLKTSVTPSATIDDLMRIPLLVQAVGLGLWLFDQSGALPPAPEVAAALQKKYDGIRDFTADFVQESEGGVLRKKQIESGMVRSRSPARCGGTTRRPEQKVFVSDGHRIYLHMPADNQVIISPVPEQDQATTAVLFLVGKGNLTRDFTVSSCRRRRPDTYALRLQPKLPERDYDWLQLVVDRRTLADPGADAPRTARAAGRRSSSRISRKTSDLSDKTFTFKIPRGADVTNNGCTVALKRCAGAAPPCGCSADLCVGGCATSSAVPCGQSARRAHRTTTGPSSNTRNAVRENPTTAPRAGARARPTARPHRSTSFAAGGSRRRSDTRRRSSSTRSPRS